MFDVQGLLSYARNNYVIIYVIMLILMPMLTSDMSRYTLSMELLGDPTFKNIIDNTINQRVPQHEKSSCEFWESCSLLVKTSMKLK